MHKVRHPYTHLLNSGCVYVKWSAVVFLVRMHIVSFRSLARNSMSGLEVFHDGAWNSCCDFFTRTRITSWSRHDTRTHLFPEEPTDDGDSLEEN